MALTEQLNKNRQKPAKGRRSEYVADTRPMCQGTPFVLTDTAHPRLVLKSGSNFVILDGEAYVPACSTLGYGYYRYDTRHLSEWEVTLDGVPLSLLSSDVEKGYAGSFLYTNPQTPNIAQQKIMVQRQLVIDDVVAERMVIENFDSKEVTVDLSIRYQSDFADMFEVRGLNRTERGVRMRPTTDEEGRRLFLAYKGTDGCLLETVIEFGGRIPDEIVDGVARFSLTLPVRKPVHIEIFLLTRADGVLSCGEEDHLEFADMLAAADKKYSQWRSVGANLQTDHEILNLSLKRGMRDLYILRQHTPEGTGLAAGVPWYSAVFGRDSAITGWQLLPFQSGPGPRGHRCFGRLSRHQIR